MWSHRAWSESLGLGDTVPLLSDRLGVAAEGFGVLGEHLGIPRADRSAFLVDGETVVASWLLGSELPDIDVIMAAASA